MRLDVSKVKVVAVVQVFVLVPLLLAQVSGAPRSDPVREFRRRYAAESDDKARRDLVTKAIDDGLISAHTSRLSDIRRLFGKDLEREGVERDNVVCYIVLFRHYAPSTEPMMSTPVDGWYIRLYFLDDALVYYKLSNVHKSVFDG